MTNLSVLRACLVSTLSIVATGEAIGQAPAAPGQATQALPGPNVPVRPEKVVENFVPVTDEMLRAPRPEDWLLFRGNYQGWGYSPLDQITKENVKGLQLVWSRAMEPGTNEITPIVYNGVMYLGNPSDVIQAIDAATGEFIWEYRHPLPPRASFPSIWGQRKRSISLYGDYVIFATWNNLSWRSMPASENAFGRTIAAATCSSRTPAVRSSPTAW